MTKHFQSDPAHGVAHERHDAIEMLIADHKAVKKMFGHFAELQDDGNATEEKSTLVKQICAALDVHVHLEEEIFYPAVRRAIDDGSLMDKALVEQAGAKALVAQLEAMQVGDDLFDAKVMVLAEQIDHHANEEESEMFPQAKKAKVDTLALGAAMAIRRAQLVAAPRHTPSPKGKFRLGDGASMPIR